MRLVNVSMRLTEVLLEVRLLSLSNATHDDEQTIAPRLAHKSSRISQRPPCFGIMNNPVKTIGTPIGHVRETPRPWTTRHDLIHFSHALWRLS